jgi:ABC-type transporter Mla subunit MlaD
MPKAGVVMAGVRVGNVSGIELDPTGKTVTITLEILDKYRIRKDARFVIDQIGFLGDQFVSVIAGENAAPLLGPSDVVPVEEPFNLQEAARSANGLIQRVDKSVQRLTETFAKVDDLLLSDFKDDEARQQLSLLVSSLTTLSSNLNKYGLLYKPKTVKKASDSLLLYPGKK